jgi:hypothetical protein
MGAIRVYGACSAEIISEKCVRIGKVLKGPRGEGDLDEDLIRKRIIPYIEARALVYDEKDGNCYWMSIEDHRYELLDKVMKRDTLSDTIYFRIDRSHVLEDGKNKNADFKEKIVADKYSIEQFLGRPS